MKTSNGAWANPPLEATGEVTSARLSAEVLALYQRARAADPATDFKPWAMQRAAALVRFDSTNWVSGVMTPRGPRTLEVRTENMGESYWGAFSATLAEADPLGERMLANPGVSYILGQADFPPRSAAVMQAWGIESGVMGMMADRSTGTFSVLVWHRGAGQPPFGEAERRLHEQLLPHWVEGLHLHRVGVALRDLHVAARPGQLAALIEPGGVIHFAQAGFGELLVEEFVHWAGASLPPAMIQALADATAEGVGRWTGALLAATRRELPSVASGLWLVHLRRRRGTSPALAREDAASALSSALATSLGQGEQALAQAQAELRVQRRQHAVQQERERIMRELHDGLGAQLVGLLQLAGDRSVPVEALQSAVLEAQDELRLAVDAAHVIEGDLPTLLGNLRYRLQPRLDAASIAMEWDVPELPPLPALTSAAALHVQRILLEAVTNVLRHAEASRLWVAVALQGYEPPHTGPATLVVTLADDGVGLRPAGARAGAAPMAGRGTRHMHQRAAALGAALEIGDRVPGPGTRVTLRWPQ